MGFPYKKIFCALDFDDNSLVALDKAVELARHFKASILMVHVVPLIVQFGEIPIAYELYEHQQKAARARLDEIASERLSGIEHEIAVYTGDVVGSILEAVAKSAPDLVVMATHGRSGFAHLFLGSVAEGVVRKAPCPVLTIRPKLDVSGKAKQR
jgi:nucleotide-binding universal stress UspA family protein